MVVWESTSCGSQRDISSQPRTWWSGRKPSSPPMSGLSVLVLPTRWYPKSDKETWEEGLPLIPPFSFSEGSGAATPFKMSSQPKRWCRLSLSSSPPPLSIFLQPPYVGIAFGCPPSVHVEKRKMERRPLVFRPPSRFFGFRWRGWGCVVLQPKLQRLVMCQKPTKRRACHHPTAHFLALLLLCGGGGDQSPTVNYKKKKNKKKQTNKQQIGGAGNTFPQST
jgi:hypothetical protein